MRAGTEISEFLWYDLEDHFGLDPAMRDVDGMADRLVAWVGGERTVGELPSLPPEAKIRRTPLTGNDSSSENNMQVTRPADAPTAAGGAETR